MKKYMAIALLLLLMPSVMAAISIDDIRGYVNNERASDVNKDGGDFDAKPGDTLEAVVRLQNNANTTVQAKIVGTIENIDNNADVTKTQDLFDISANDDTSKTLSFAIPTNARNDEFDMEIKIKNSSDDVIKTVNFNVIVNNRINENDVSIGEILSNITSSCNMIAETTNTCFNYIGTANNCTSELSTVKEERGTYKQNAEDYSASLDSIKSEKAELERQKINLDNQISNMITMADCTNQTAAAIEIVEEKGKNNFNQTILIIALAVFGYWSYQKRKKSKASVASAYEEEYFDKG